MGSCTDLVTRAEFEAALKKKPDKPEVESLSKNITLLLLGGYVTNNALGAYATNAALNNSQQLMRGEVNGARDYAREAKNEASRASSTSKTARSVAEDVGRSNKAANAAARAEAAAAKAAAKKASYEALYASTKASSAASAAAKAGGLATKALGLFGTVFGILGTLASIASVAVLTAQVVALTKRVAANEEITAENENAIRIMKVEQSNQRKSLQNFEKTLQEQNDSIEKINSQIQQFDGLLALKDLEIKNLKTFIDQLNKRLGEEVEKGNQTAKTANDAIAKANEALNKLPEPRVPEDLSSVYAEIDNLKRQNELLKSDTNAFRAALNTSLARIEQKEDKLIVRRVEKQTITNASGIRDLNGQVVGLPSKFGQVIEGNSQTLRQEFRQGDVNTKNDVINITGLNKPQVEQIVDTKLKDVTKMNEQQASQINSKLDSLNNKVPSLLTPMSIAITVGALDIFRQILSKPTGGGGTCFAPQLVPPVAAQTRTNFAAIGTLQGVTITQAGFIQKSVNVVATTTKTTLDVVKHGTYGLEAIQRFASTAWKATHMDKVLNTLSVVIALHNAAMLSRNLGETLGELTSQALSTIGIKDSDGSPLDINAAISNSVNAMLTNILGAETFLGIKETWNKSSRILSSASQIVWTVRSIADSTREITEWTAENTGKIGNALKRWRVVGENAYSWMPERMTATNKWLARVERTRNGIDSLDDAASSFSSVLGEAQNIQQEWGELEEQGTKFQDNIKDLTPKEREPNEPVQLAREEEREASKSSANQADVFRGEGEQE